MIYYYINSYTDGWFYFTLTSMPKTIALGIAFLALMFPRDYDRIPDWIYGKIKKSNR